MYRVKPGPVLFMHPFIGSGRVTLAIQPYYNNIGNYGEFIKVAAAWCSPTDNFNRKIGRKIATGRLHQKKFSMALPFDNSKPVKQQVCETISNMLKKKIGDFPSWAYTEKPEVQVTQIINSYLRPFWSF